MKDPILIKKSPSNGAFFVSSPRYTLIDTHYARRFPIPCPSWYIRVKSVATFMGRGYFMADKFTREEEEQIDDLRLQLEAQRREAINRLTDKLLEFRQDFPRATPDSYRVKLTPSQLRRIVEDYTGETSPLELIYATLEASGYTKMVDKETSPIQVYWLFN